MISYSRKVGLRKPGTFEWARSQIPPDSDGLAEWIAYQESVLNQDQVESLRQWWHGYETRSIVEIEPGPDIDQDDLLAHCGNRTLTGDHHAVCDCPPSANLVDTIRKTADRYDLRGQESDDGQVHGPDGWWGGS